MANLTIKNLPDDLYARLKAQAQRRRRSINREAIVCLEEALDGARPPDYEERLNEEIDAMHRRIGPLPDLGEVLAEAKRERDARPLR